VVERTFAWLGRYRRLSKDYEYLPATAENTVYLAMTLTLTRRWHDLTLFRHPLALPEVSTVFVCCSSQ
jgi:hypothetical protein